MKEVLEKLFQQIPVGPTEPMEKLKQELFAAAEHGYEAIQDYFERAGQSLLEEAKTLVQRLRSKIGDS
jgi:epoxyqueuosine reductase QueG